MLDIRHCNGIVMLLAVFEFVHKLLLQQEQKVYGGESRENL